MQLAALPMGANSVLISFPWLGKPKRGTAMKSITNSLRCRCRFEGNKKYASDVQLAALLVGAIPVLKWALFDIYGPFRVVTDSISIMG